MTYDGLSKFHPTNSFMTKDSTTFADVMMQISTDRALSATRRRDLLSSVRCLFRLMEIEPAATPASPGAIRERLKRIHPVQANISAKRFANIKADVAFALRHLGLTGSTLRNGKGLGPSWQTLWKAIKDGQTRWPMWFKMAKNAREFLVRQPKIHNGFATSQQDPALRSAIDDKFEVEERNGELVVHYRSPNQLCGLYMALARWIINHYGDNAVVEEASCAKNGASQCEIHVRWA